MLCPKMRTRPLLLFLVGMLALSTASAAPAFMYGIDDNNEIVQYDPVNKMTRLVQDTGLTTSQGSNAFAFDEVRNQMFWLYKGDATNPAGLYYWDQVTGTIDRIASQAQTWGNQGFPANAVYYRDPSTGISYFVWITEGGSTVNFLPITYDASGNPTGVGANIQRTISGPSFSPSFMRFGDIAIQTSTKQLYLATSNGRFSKIDLTNAFGQALLPYTEIKTGNPSLQLAFDCEENILYGQQYVATDTGSDNWYTINLATGVTTTIPNYSTEGARLSARDLGGSSCTDSPLTAR